ncbi:ThiF family adenylyltransferase, partial [Microvirga sp. 3-52]|nr:ThiF family adenylyltransferase [Microvirga sp. 3-52]
MNERYSRQELFTPIGEEGQALIRNASVFILGAGALGSSAGEMLVRAGIGRITIVDRDIIDWTNLHRQQLYTE